jgi:hypothetical protein
LNRFERFLPITRFTDDLEVRVGRQDRPQRLSDILYVIH